MGQHTVDMMGRLMGTGCEAGSAFSANAGKVSGGNFFKIG